MSVVGGPTSLQAGARTRTVTGVPGLDVVLGGGLPSGRSTLVAGTSGSGKTVLGLQFLWAGAVSSDEPGVLVTFEERPDGLFANVGGFGWDLAALTREDRLAVVDATPEDDVVEVGSFDFGGLLSRIEHAVRRTGARRLLVDAIDAVFSQFGEAGTVRHELGRLIGRLREMEVTTLITAERLDEYGPVARRGVEEFVVDNVIILRNVLQGRNRQRTVEVLKLRGFAHNKGEYAFVIAPGHGMEVVPVSTIESDEPAAATRISLGNAEFDALCGGGVYRDALLLVSGATGTGKSLLAAQFVTAGLDAGDRAILFSFEENPSQVIRDAASCGVDLDTPRRQGRLRIISRYPERMGLEDLLVAMKADVEQHAPQRVVIDSLTALEHSAPPSAFRELVVGISAFLRARGVAAMIVTASAELVGATSISGAELSTLTDGIILLRYMELGGELRRVVLVLKMRGTGHDRTLHEFEITDHGLRLLGTVPAVGVLGGTLRYEQAPEDRGAAGQGTAGLGSG